jgi:predicted lipid carrier protein YhbT
MILPALPRPLAALLARLTAYPPSAAFAAALNVALLSRLLPREALAPIEGRRIRIVAEDLGLRVEFMLTAQGFRPCARQTPPDLTICAEARDFLRLAARLEDPDALFFSRRLVLQGDTELGLQIKNTLDAVDWPPRWLRAVAATVLRKDFPGPGG